MDNAAVKNEFDEAMDEMQSTTLDKVSRTAAHVLAQKIMDRQANTLALDTARFASSV